MKTELYYHDGLAVKKDDKFQVAQWGTCRVLSIARDGVISRCRNVQTGEYFELGADVFNEADLIARGIKIDRRYSIDRGFCGYEKPRWIVRFCGDFVSSHPTKEGAREAARAHRVAFLEAAGVAIFLR
jgi:hypothetical protein